MESNQEELKDIFIEVLKRKIKYFDLVSLVAELDTSDKIKIKKIKIGGENYFVTDILGDGGIGKVYLAKNYEAKDVAIKIPCVKSSETYLDEPIEKQKDLEFKIKSLIHESTIMSHVEGENVVKIKATGYTSRNIPCLVMEYLNEGCLRDFLNKHIELGFAIPSKIIAYILYKVAAGCEQAYNSYLNGKKMEIVHQDLSPENIGIITNDHNKESEAIKVMDFGIALRKGTSRIGMGLSGKENYCSPEQVNVPILDRETPAVDSLTKTELLRKWIADVDLDITSDVYSMCLIAYELAVMENPFSKARQKTEKNHQIKTEEQILYNISDLREKPLFTLSEAIDGFDNNLSDIISKGMSKFCDERFISYKALKADILIKVFDGMMPKNSNFKAYVKIINFLHDEFNKRIKK